MRIAAACLFVHIILAPTLAWAAAPTLRVQGDDGNVALALTALEVRVTVRGHLARTEFDLTYRNDLDRDTEGEFEFPLPADAEVSDVGLYFGGVLRHAVAVERVLARTAYDESLHMGVDPALVEWNSGRSFKLRVCPIPAKGVKKVFLAYDQELTTTDYELDVAYARSLEPFELHVDAEGRERVLDGVVKIAREPGQTALAARAPEDGLWYASAAVDLAGPGAEVPRAEQVVILYDSSASSVQQNGAALRRFLEAFLGRQHAGVTAEVIPFDVALRSSRTIERAGTGGGAVELERVLRDQQALGATNLMTVANELPRIAATLPVLSRVVLVTDGLTSLGNGRDVSAAFLRLARLRRPLVVVNASPSADESLLSSTAAATGGWWLDLSAMDPESAAAAAMRIPRRLELPDPLLPRSVRWTSDTRVSVAARSQQTLTTLPFADGRELPLRELADGRGASMIRRAWARARLREMLAANAPDEELIEHGRRYLQLTPRTSLIVLDSWRDYERYGIPMPPDVVAEKEKYLADHVQLQVQRPGTPASPPSKMIPGGWFLSGRTLDDSGAPLPGVTVTLLDGGAPLVYDVTDSEGSFVVSAATAPQHPGIRAELAGFQTTHRNFGEPLASGAAVDVIVTIAAVAEAITVTAAAPAAATAPQDGVTAAAPLASLRTAPDTTDALLNAIASGEIAEGEEADDLREAVAKRRRELTAAVIDKLRGIDSPAERLRYYLSARALLGGDKGFHAFAAEVFRERSPELAARVLSDLAEARPDDAPLLRILARVLDGWGQSALARLLLERAIEISPTEPQSWREMLLVEARRGAPASFASWARRMAATKRDRWMEGEVHEQTAPLLERWERAGILERSRGIDLRADPANDLTIELMFDSGWCYVDLHVIEPSRERVTWNHTASAAGATFSGGSTLGFGPEIYTLRKAPPGNYELSIDYWSTDDTGVSLETLVHVIVYERGRKGTLERRDHLAVLTFWDEDRSLPPATVR